MNNLNKFTYAQVSELIGKKTNYLRSLKSKKKIIVEDGLIDLDNPINKAWFNLKRKEFLANSDFSSVVVSNNKEKKNTTNESDVNISDKKSSLEIPNDSDVSSYTIENIEQVMFDTKKEALRKLIHEANIKQLDEGKKKGEISEEMGRITQKYIEIFLQRSNRDLESYVGKFLDVLKVPLDKKTKIITGIMPILNKIASDTQRELKAKYKDIENG